MTEDRLRMLQETPLFGGIRDDVLRYLLENVKEIVLPKDEFLFLENDVADSMYLLEAGEVAILKRWQEYYFRLNYLHAGDCIGEMSLIDLGRRSASVLAIADCRAIELTYGHLLDLYQRDLEQFAMIQMNMAREVSRRLRVADETLFQEMIKAGQYPQH